MAEFPCIFGDEGNVILRLDVEQAHADDRENDGHLDDDNNGIDARRFLECLGSEGRRPS